MEFPAWLTPLLTLLFTTGGIGGVWVLIRKERRQAPIEWRTAQVADASAISTAANELVATVMERMEVQDRKIDAQDRVIDTLRATLREIQAGWDGWYYDLRTGWHEHRTRDQAPPPPMHTGSK